MQLMSELRSHTVQNIYSLEGDTPMTKLTGATCDISHLCEFSWYNPVWFIDITDPMQNKKKARYLGPSHDVGQAMCSKLLTQNTRVIFQTSVIPLSPADINNPIVKDLILECDKKLTEALGDRAAGLPPDFTDNEMEERE
jgi:hypothetical protein